MSEHNIVDPSGVRVMAAMCPTCIFRPGNLMRLNPGRVRGMIAEAERKGGTIVCHDTLDDELHACCRGFFDRHPTQLLQVAERLGFVVWHERAP